MPVAPQQGGRLMGVSSQPAASRKTAATTGQSGGVPGWTPPASTAAGSQATTYAEAKVLVAASRPRRGTIRATYRRPGTASGSIMATVITTQSRAPRPAPDSHSSPGWPVVVRCDVPWS